ncbi:MAG: FAD-dependent oxidoreductase [Campylobacterales bacterium]|nr:FAD-dependent oxidoreductase [Campylobacterales bacterium]
MYDVAIIGAGVNGCNVAHAFGEEKKSVILFDMDGIASGGSGAAGAFIAPKFSKSGELKELIHDAFVYSMDFYEKNFSSHLTKAPLLHIAQDENDSEILKSYKENSTLKLKIPSKKVLELLVPHAKSQENICLNGGVVNAKAVCEAMSKNAKLVKEKVESLVYDDGMWIINETYSAKVVVLATGAYETLIKEPYIQLRGIWGHRIDIKTTTQNPYSIHQFVSISPSKDGVLAIGATHNVHYHPQTTIEPYDINEGRAELLEKASRTLNLENIEIIRDYTGLRSGSFDYMPLIGSLVISKETLACGTLSFKTKKPNHDEYMTYPNLYMINGNGGYGFVLAPYLANLLSKHVLSGKKISERLTPARFFARWAKKL